MRIRLVLAAPAAAAVMALPLAVVVAQPGGAAGKPAPSYSFPTVEVNNLKTLLPLVRDWQNAINRRDRTAGLTAAENYELIWQGVEVYINHRSLVLYQDLEPDTQFVMDAELAKAQPDWAKLRTLGRHLLDDVNAMIDLAAAGPVLSPLFDDLVPLRTARAYVNVARDAAVAGDLTKARAFLAGFETRFPAVKSLISFRSTTALAETEAALAVLTARLADAGTPLADVQAAMAGFASRLGFGVNLLNAAARGADRTKTGITATDRTLLTTLNTIANGVRAGSADAGATGPGSAFASVQPALEAKGRFINTAGPLRTALTAYQNALAASPTAEQFAVVQRAALDQIDIARQALVGQFWGTPDLTAFLAGLPTS